MSKPLLDHSCATSTAIARDIEMDETTAFETSERENTAIRQRNKEITTETYLTMDFDGADSVTEYSKASIRIHSPTETQSALRFFKAGTENCVPAWHIMKREKPLAANVGPMSLDGRPPACHPFPTRSNRK